MEIGETIRTLRKAAGFSQKEFARCLGISPGYLSLLETGIREPSVSFLRQVSGELKVPVSVLLCGGENAPAGLTEEQQQQFRRVRELSLDILQRALLRSVEGTFI